MVNIDYKLVFLILSSSLLVTSCALVSTTSTNSIAIKQFGFAKTAAEIISLSYTEKSTTDHAISIALKKDCKVSRIIRSEEICLDYGPNVFLKNKNNAKGKLKNQIMHVAVAAHNSDQLVISLPRNSIEVETKNNLDDIAPLPANASNDYNLPHNLYSVNENVSEENKSLDFEMLSHHLSSTNNAYLLSESNIDELNNNLNSSI